MTGLGLFAKRDIKRGTCILSESPLVVVHTKGEEEYSRLWQQLEGLSTSQLGQLDALQCNKELLSKRARLRIRNTVVLSGKFRKCTDVQSGFVETATNRQGM